MLEKFIKKDQFSIYRSLAKMNYDESSKMYISFQMHISSRSIQKTDVLLSEKELDILINELQEAKKVLQESNKNKNLKG